LSFSFIKLDVLMSDGRSEVVLTERGVVLEVIGRLSVFKERSSSSSQLRGG